MTGRILKPQYHRGYGAQQVQDDEGGEALGFDDDGEDHRSVNDSDGMV